MGDARQAVEFCLHSPLSELHQSGLGQRRALDRIAVVTGEHDVKAVLPPAKATPALRPIERAEAVEVDPVRNHAYLPGIQIGRQRGAKVLGLHDHPCGPPGRAPGGRHAVTGAQRLHRS
jgi:hypothetical protein